MMRGRANRLVMLTLTRSSFWHKWKGGFTWLGEESMNNKGLRGSCVSLRYIFRIPWGKLLCYSLRYRKLWTTLQ